jgi:hypothetical protein
MGCGEGVPLDPAMLACTTVDATGLVLPSVDGTMVSSWPATSFSA